MKPKVAPNCLVERLSWKVVVSLAKLAKQAIGGTGEVAAEETEKLIESLSEDALDAGTASMEEAASTESLDTLAENGAAEVIEAVVESSTSAALASTGVGIFLAVGIGVIFAAFNGVKEQNQLNDMLKQLDEKMKTINTYLATVSDKSAEINNNMIEGISAFQKSLQK